ncbi:MAG: amidohydrolase family protein [Candidatus Bathyarchaeota archaeon]|nr:amidohydrolase family protein [Candidatus Bathyarchaeota archaeon]
MTTKAIIGARLIDGTGKKPVDEAVVLIKDKLIMEAGKGIDIPKDAEVINAEGKSLLPGLIDSHVHICSNGDPNILSSLSYRKGMMQLFGYRNGVNDLESGFTTIRDMGAPYDYGLSLRDAVRTGVVKGPRILACGNIISMTGGHADFHLPSGISFDGMSRLADGVADCRKAAREQLRSGADFLKICSSGGVMSPTDPVDTPQFTVEEIKAITYEAACVGRRVASHAHGATGIKNAIEAGVTTIEHGSLIDEEGMKMLKEAEGFLVPTLVAGWNIVEHGLESGIPKYAVDKADEIAHEVRKNAYKAYKMGVKVAVGTDAGTPFNLHGNNAQEIIHFVDMGLKPMEAIVAATKTGSECLGLEKMIGTVEKGKLADLILVDGDPLKDIKVLGVKENIKLVMKEGTVEVNRGI